MTRLLVLLVALSGCAVGRIRPGAIDCAAVGHAACVLKADGSEEVHGGALSNNLSELLSSLITAAGIAYGGGVIP